MIFLDFNQVAGPQLNDEMAYDLNGMKMLWGWVLAVNRCEGGPSEQERTSEEWSLPAQLTVPPPSACLRLSTLSLGACS